MAYKERKLTPTQVLMRTVSSHVSWWLGRRFPKAIPLVFVSGYPRSGTVWASQLVAEYMQLPFPRNSLLPVGCPAVVHAHHLIRATDGPSVYMVRDVRDTMVSAYHFYLSSVPPGDNPSMPRAIRRAFPGLVNKENITDNLPRFIEQQMKRPISVPCTWYRHVTTHLDLPNPRLAIMKYEELLNDTVNTLRTAMARLTDEEIDDEGLERAAKKYHFEKQAGRARGQENRSSHMRKGTAGEWRSVFTLEAAQIIDHYCGDLLIRLGYEKDHSWVDSIAQRSPSPGNARLETA